MAKIKEQIKSYRVNSVSDVDEGELSKEKQSEIISFMKDEKNLSNINPDDINIAQHLYDAVAHKKYSEIMEFLNLLSLPKDTTLEVKEAEEVGIGMYSRLYIKCIDESNKNTYNVYRSERSFTHEWIDRIITNDIFDYIQVDDSFSGAWQVYLLFNLWHILPFFWHGYYDHYDFIFSTECINAIKTIDRDESGREKIINKLREYDVTPRISRRGNDYYISCCYWNDWQGLVRQVVQITINNNLAIRIIPIDKDVLYENLCRIRF